MKNERQPVYMIGVAAQLCGIHPQTLRQYERLGLVIPSRVGAKNRLYSEADIQRIRRIQRLTKEMGVNLAGVEVILRLLDDMDQQRQEFERAFNDFRMEAEQRMAQLLENPSMPIRRDESLLPVPNLPRRQADL